MDLAVIILNYKNAKDTLSLLDSIESTNQIPHKIFVVDNASEDDSVSILKKSLKEDQTLIVSKKNDGYANGNNQGIQAAVKEGYNYFLILNNDTLVTDNLFLQLINFLQKNPDVGIVGPGICTYENPKILESAGSLVNFNTGKIVRLYNSNNVSSIKNKEINCDYVGGACLAFSKSLIDSIGLIPENYFLFFEETEWCIKAKKNGFKIICLGNSLIIHKGSATINHFTGLSEYYTYRNLVLFIKRNGSLKNKMIFYPYIFSFAIKSLLTKKNGGRYFRYIKDGLLEKDTFRLTQGGK